MRIELKYMNELSRQAVLLSENKISSLYDLNTFRTKLEDEVRTLKGIRESFQSPLVQELQENFKVKFSSTRTEPEYMNLKNIKKYINHSHLLIKGIESGDIENILQFFDGKDKEKIYDEER